MNKKATLVGASVVALAGSGLAVALPTASSAKTPQAVATTCTTSTDPTVAPYTEYCEVTAPPSVSFTAGPGVAVGTVLEPGVTVTGNNNGLLTISDNGQTFTIPSGAAVTVYADGTLFINTLSKAYGKLIVRTIDTTVTGTYLQTANGITFGYNNSKAKILRYVKFYNGPKLDPPKVALLLSKPHGKLLSSLSTPTQDLTIGINSNILQYTKEEIKLIKGHKLKEAAVAVKIGTASGTVYSYKMYTPITKLTLIAPVKKK